MRELLIGEPFGYLTVTGPSVTRMVGNRPRLFWPCVCDCGIQKEIEHYSVISENSSCGCLHHQRISNARILHGHARKGKESSEYVCWMSMRWRCYNSNNKSFKDYGARGITVCDRWRNSFEAFLEDMGPRPSPKHSIERNNNDAYYAPGNCTWAKRKVQNRNKRTNRILTFKGRSMCVSAWAEEVGIGAQNLWQRIFKHGWSVEDALTRPERRFTNRKKDRY